MSSEFGKMIHVSVFGESHGPAIGVLIDGLPSGEMINMDELNAFLGRRRPGQSKRSTARKETDQPDFLSGVLNGRTCGSPILAMIRNCDQHSQDYEVLKNTPRPGHADLTAFVKYHGFADMRGGGHFSGRLTAPLCVAGGIALQILARKGIHIGAHLASVGGVCDEPFPLHPDRELFEQLAKKTIPVLDDEAGQRMSQEIDDAIANLDSVGGIIEIAAIGVPAGLGAPMFDGMEGRLAQAYFGIPAVKGVEFGLGFIVAASRGSDCNDPMFMDGNQVLSSSNHCGGILGGITNGMPIIARLAMKPTPSIAKIQQTVNLVTRTSENLEIKGRHDPCVAIRAVPVVEAMTALTLLDMFLEYEAYAHMQ